MQRRTGALVLLVTAAILLLWRTPVVAGPPHAVDGTSAAGGGAPVGTAPGALPSLDGASGTMPPVTDSLPAIVAPAGGGSGAATAGGASGSAPRPEATAPRPAPNAVLVLGSVFFASNQRTLGPDATHMLEGIAATYKGTTQQLEIVGHADARGSAAANLQLSAARAEAVRAFLEQQGIPSSSMQVRYDGARTPMARGVDPEANATNRRVEIRVPRP